MVVSSCVCVCVTLQVLMIYSIIIGTTERDNILVFDFQFIGFVF